jgi:lipopolysaccharide heptosyltransferase II
MESLAHRSHFDYYSTIMSSPGDFRNILIIKPGAIGDLLQMTPVIRALKLKYPSARVSLLVGSWQTAQLFKYNERVHETLLYEKNEEHRTFGSLLALRRQLKMHQYDLVVNFQRSNLRTWFLASAAIPCRMLVYHKARKRKVHAVVNYLETLAPLGIGARDVSLELTPGPEDREYARNLLAGMGTGAGAPLIALNPGASHTVNRWPPKRFAELADRMSDRLSARVLLVGGPDDVPLVGEILARTASKPMSLAGKISLLETAAVMEQASLLVSGDTGPLHLATAVGTRVVALFGAADPERTGPVGPGHIVLRSDAPCVPCRSRTCTNKNHLACMDKISVDRVFSAVTSMLHASPAI